MFDVVIVGGGLAGLTCARRLQAQGRACLVLDAADAVGGRVRTDHVDGFQLDRGFQVLLTAYPAAQRWLDYDALSLGRFNSGARVWCEGALHVVSDPTRESGDLLATLKAPVGTLADKMKIATLRSEACRGALDDVFTRLAQHYNVAPVPILDQRQHDALAETAQEIRRFSHLGLYHDERF